MNLLEYTGIAKNLSSQFEKKISMRLQSDPSAPENIQPEQFVGWLQDEVAPEPNRAYTEWLLSRYLNGGINRYEDFSKAKEHLELFNRNKSKLPVRDIGRFKNEPELFDFLKQNQLSTVSKSDLDQYAKTTTDLIYNGPEGQIVQPHTEAAACYYGRGTNWCISAETAQNYFKTYSHQNGVDFWFVFPKDGSKWALVFMDGEISEIFDEADDSVDVDDFFRNHKWVTPVVEKYTGISVNTGIDTSDSVIDIVKKLVKMIRNDQNPEQIQDVWDDLSPDQQLAIVDHYPEMIKLSKNPPEWLQRAVIKSDPLSIVYISDPSESVQLAAVKKNGNAIEYISDPAESVQLAAVKRTGNAIRYIDNPSEAVQLAAAKRDGYVIKFIDGPSESVQLAAVGQSGYAIKLIDDPSEAVQIAAVGQNGYAINYIDDPSEAVQIAAVKQNGSAIRYIDGPSEAVQLAAVRQDGRAIKFIDDPVPSVNN